MISSRERTWRVVVPGALALFFLVFHLPYVPRSLEDLDSVNFALGIRHFDVAQHQPHPPGYPVFIAVAKAVNRLTSSELIALSALSIVSGALGAFAIASLYRRLDHQRIEWSVAAAAIAITSPLYWFTSARPLSDVTGLAVAVGVQSMTLGATTPLMLYASSFAAALGIGVRSQVAWLTLPLLILRMVEQPVTFRSGVRTLATFAAGIALWAVPLVVLTGGPSAYWRAVAFQGGADLADIQMLWTHHDPRSVADAFYFAFVAPWAIWTVAAIVLVLAAAGVIWMFVGYRRPLVLLTAAFGPYFIFDLLFQETFTTRYALPLVVPVAFLAVAGARLLPWRFGPIVLAALSIFDAHAGGTSLSAYSRDKAPAFRLLDDMRRAGDGDRGAGGRSPSPDAPVIALDRRQWFDFRRPIVWAGAALPRFDRMLPAPPQHEWLEPVKYWTGGGRAPVWYVVDPKRTSIELVQHGEPVKYRWPLTYPVLVGGVRPNEMDFYRVDAPEWFVGEGWALTPEAAGVSAADRRGPSLAPIEAWISRRVLGGVMLIGGRNFSAQETTLTIDVDDVEPRAVPAPPGFFLHAIPLMKANGPFADYLKLTAKAPSGTNVAIEQFDAAAGRPIFGFGAGWHEQEFNPRTGLRWRWVSERGELRFGAPSPRITLHVEGESPRTYFERGSHVTARAGDRVIFDDVLTSDFVLDLPVPDGSEVITLETDQVFQPADRSRRSADRRHLGLRIFKCELRPVS